MTNSRHSEQGQVGKTAVIIAAAGAGTRLGADTPKLFVDLGGKPLVCHALEVFEHCSAVDRIILVVPPGIETKVQAEIVDRFHSGKVVEIVPGGVSRAESVYAGLGTVGSGIQTVLIHDGARPFVSEDLVLRVLHAAELSGAAVPGIPSTDTLKRVQDGVAVATLDRSRILRIQTPQAFQYELLKEAHDRARDLGETATDDSVLVEKLGTHVRVVSGSPLNFKITTRENLQLARALLAARGRDLRIGYGMDAQTDLRIGYGMDAHRLVSGRKLILGGIEIPYEKGLEGHSDADVLAHAIGDAILGALALGDLGRHFPDTDVQYKDCSSLRLLERIMVMARAKGADIQNVDSTVTAEAPKLAPHIEPMRKKLGEALGLPPERVSVKATTSEGMGFCGRGEGIEARAVVLVRVGADPCGRNVQPDSSNG